MTHDAMVVNHNIGMAGYGETRQKAGKKNVVLLVTIF